VFDKIEVSDARFLMDKFVYRRFVINGLPRWFPAMILLAGTVYGDPSPAEASCGDYVIAVSRHAKPSSRDRSFERIDFDHESPRKSPGKSRGDPIPVQCHGAGCSNGSYPPALPTHRTKTAVELWAHLNGVVPPGLPPWNRWVLEPSSDIAEGHARRLLRPPK
jgi:hypothetical protein